jgi:hypothetical protein
MEAKERGATTLSFMLNDDWELQNKLTMLSRALYENSIPEKLVAMKRLIAVS